MNPAEALAEFKVDAVRLRQQVTALVDRERAKHQALCELSEAVAELIELAPRGSHARKLAERLIERPLAKARMLTAA